MNTPSNVAQQSLPAHTQAHLATVNADPKWERRRKVIEVLNDYKQSFDAEKKNRERYSFICAHLYSGRSSKITGLPTNHDQFAASDAFAQMLDEKMVLEKALVDQSSAQRDMELMLRWLDPQERSAINAFYLADPHQKALGTLQSMFGMSLSGIYRLRNKALDDLTEILFLTTDNTQTDDYEG